MHQKTEALDASSAKIVKKNMSNHVYRVFKHEMLYWNQISSLNDFFLFEKSRSAIICQKCHRLLQLLLQFLNNSLLPGHKSCDLYNRLELQMKCQKPSCGLSRKIFILLYVQYVEKLALDCVINEIKGRRPTK